MAKQTTQSTQAKTRYHIEHPDADVQQGHGYVVEEKNSLLPDGSFLFASRHVRACAGQHGYLCITKEHPEGWKPCFVNFQTRTAVYVRDEPVQKVKP